MKKNKIKIKLKKINSAEKNIFKKILLDYLFDLNSKKKFFRKKIIFKYIKNTLNNYDKKKYLIFINKIIVGFFIINFSKNINNQKVCYINDFYIKKDFRKKGLATNTIKKIMLICKKKRINELRIEILSNNSSALKFWTKFKLYQKSTNYIIKI